MLLAVGSRFRIRTGAQTSKTAVAPTQSLNEWAPSFFLGGKVVGDVNSNTHLHIVRSLRLGGVLPPICPCGGIDFYVLYLPKIVYIPFSCGSGVPRSFVRGGREVFNKFS